MTYTIRVDERGREVLLNALSDVKQEAERLIVKGDQSTEQLTTHEELLQLHRGILYIRPDPEKEEVVEDPAALETNDG